MNRGSRRLTLTRHNGIVSDHHMRRWSPITLTRDAGKVVVAAERPVWFVAQDENQDAGQGFDG